MKFLVFKFLSTLFYLIITSVSHSIEPPDINNIIINKDNKSYKNVIFKDVNNQDVKLDDFKNKLVIINFWATWCVPCRKEMPSLDMLQSDKRLSNLKVFPINVGKEDILKSKVFFKELNIKNLDIYFDPTVGLANQFLLRGLPTSILINKKGQEFARIMGYVDFNDQKFINWLKNFN